MTFIYVSKKQLHCDAVNGLHVTGYSTNANCSLQRQGIVNNSTAFN